MFAVCILYFCFSGMGYNVYAWPTMLNIITWLHAFLIHISIIILRRFIYLLFVSVSTTYNIGHNILELYKVLIQTWLTTSTTKCDI